MTKRFVGEHLICMDGLVGRNCAIWTAQQNRASNGASQDSGGKWDEITDRMVFLMTRLVNVEAALDVIRTVTQRTLRRTNRFNAAGADGEGKTAINASASAPSSRANTTRCWLRSFTFILQVDSPDYHTIAILNPHPPKTTIQAPAWCRGKNAADGRIRRSVSGCEIRCRDFAAKAHRPEIEATSARFGIRNKRSFGTQSQCARLPITICRGSLYTASSRTASRSARRACNNRSRPRRRHCSCRRRLPYRRRRNAIRPVDMGWRHKLGRGTWSV